jgi:hypothetical protein
MKKISEEEERTKFLAACTNALQFTDNKITENDAFGTFVSKKLEKVKNDCQRMYAETLISKILNYAIMEKLNEDSDVQLVPPDASSSRNSYHSGGTSLTSSIHDSPILEELLSLHPFMNLPTVKFTQRCIFHCVNIFQTTSQPNNND